MKTKLLILFCSLAWSIGFAQNHHKTDSLKQELAAAESDSARYATLYMLYREFVEIVNDSALYYLEQQISIAERNDKKLALAKALDNKGYVLMGLERYSESFQALKEGFEIAENPKNESSAWFPATQGTPHEIRMWTLGHLHLDYGHLMRAGNMTDQQLFHYMEAEKFAKQAGDYELLGIVNANLASRYLWALNELDSALLMYQKALTYFAQAGQKKWLAGVFADLAEIYKRKKEARLAVGYFHKAVQASQSINDFNSLYWNYYSLTVFYINEQNRDSSLYYAQRMVELAHLHPEHFKQDVGASYLLLSESYELNNQIDSAFKYLRLESPFRDSSYRVSTRNLSNVQKLSFEEQLRAEQLEKEKAALQNRIRQIILLGGLAAVLLVAFFLYRNNRQKQKANRLLKRQRDEIHTQKQSLEKALSDLKSTQSQLIQSEKLASLGELTAGIAHEIQNPLNFVNNFSELSVDLAKELKEEMDKVEIPEKDKNYITEILTDLSSNQQKINHHGKRAATIVSGMLQHARSSTGTKEPTDLNALADEYLRLAYHGLRAKDPNFNAAMETHFDPAIGKVDVIPQDMGRVLLNLINNAFYAVSQKAKQGQEGYEPTVTVSTQKMDNQVVVKVKDNGTGIPDEVKDRVFQPFFTTKPTGQGTGLGLSLAYDIVTKGHGGALEVETKEGEGTEFTIILPAKTNGQ